jgi:hypothetical protein
MARNIEQQDTRTTGRVSVEIQGTSPLLMNRFYIEALEKPAMKVSSIKKAGEEYGSVAEQAAKTAYWTQDGKSLCIPAEVLMGSILNSGRSFMVKQSGKSRASSISSFLAGAIKIEPFEVPLGTKDYEADVRGVVIATGMKRNRIARVRAKVPIWKAKFEILYNKTLLQNPQILQDVLVDAGQRIGIMDFRPERKGAFGCYKVTKFEVVS